VIPARDELLHLVECLTDAECEQALELLLPLRGSRCPYCGVSDLDQLVWDEDGEYVSCDDCGFCWDPNRILVHRP
jgi:DNA-directed RNA polymerase subunit RPC12/RpoP